MTTSDLWAMITALATVATAAVALFALVQSYKTRKNSTFNALFSQLIANHKGTTCKKQCTEFYKYFYDRIDDVKTICDLVDLWAEFQKGLGIEKSVRFSHTFKYVYHEVTTVHKEGTISPSAKRHYIGIIQSLMNKDELFCYLINLLQHFEIYPDDENDYREQLKQYRFFDDLLRDKDDRYREVMAHLCTYLYVDVSKIIDL